MADSGLDYSYFAAINNINVCGDTIPREAHPLPALPTHLLACCAWVRHATRLETQTSDVRVHVAREILRDLRIYER